MPFTPAGAQSSHFVSAFAMQAALVISAFLSATAPVSAGVNEFTAIGPEGGLVEEIVFNPDDSSIVYAATAAGVYRSANGGEDWQFIADEFANQPADIAVHPSSPNHVFVAPPVYGVFSSSDDGLSFDQVSTFPAPNETTGHVDIAPDGMIYVATTDRLYRSDDLGVSWEEGGALPPTDSAVRLLRADPNTPGALYVLTGDTDLFFTDDQGASWTAIEVPPGTYVSDLAVAGASPARVWLATNTGVWSKLENEEDWMNAVGGIFATVDVDPVDPNVIYASDRNGMHRSENLGQDWTSIQNGARTGSITTVAIDPTDSDRLLMGGFEGIVGSSDAGITWEERNTGLSNALAERVIAAPASDRIYVETSARGLYAIDGDSLAITSLDNDELRNFGPFPLLMNAWALHVASEAPDELLVALGSGVARSENGGASWQLHDTPEFANAGVQFFASPVVDEERVLLAGTQAGLYRSTDSGVTWPAVAGLEGYDYFGVAVASSASDPAVLYMSARTSANGFVLLRSEDGGATWAPTPLVTTSEIIAVAVAPTDDRVMYAGTSQELLRSTDGGETWTGLLWFDHLEPAIAIAIDPSNSDIVFATNSRTIKRSVDGGETWESLPTPESPHYSYVRSFVIDPNRPHRLFAAAQAQGVREISIEPDLALEVTGPSGSVLTGAQAVFTLEVTNRGPFDATNVTTTVVLDGPAATSTATAPGAVCNSTTAQLSCTRPVQRVGESTEVTVNVTYSAAGTAGFSATVAGDQPDPVSTDNSVELSRTVTVPPPPAPQPAPPKSGGGGGSTTTLLLGILCLLTHVRYRTRKTSEAS